MSAATSLRMLLPPTAAYVGLALPWPDAVNLPRQVGARTVASSFPSRGIPFHLGMMRLPMKKCWFDRMCRATRKAKPG